MASKTLYWSREHGLAGALDKYAQVSVSYSDKGSPQSTTPEAIEAFLECMADIRHGLVDGGHFSGQLDIDDQVTINFSFPYEA